MDYLENKPWIMPYYNWHSHLHQKEKLAIQKVLSSKRFRKERINIYGTASLLECLHVCGTIIVMLMLI